MNLVSRLKTRFKTEFVSQIISVVSGAILTIALARLLDPDAYGLLFLAISVVGTVKHFSELGIARSAARYIAKYKETDPSQLDHVLKFSLILNVSTLSIICFLFLAGHRYIATLIGEPDLVPFLSLGVWFIAFGTLATYVRKTLQGFEAIEIGAVLQAANRGTKLVLALALVLLGYGAIGALIGYIVGFMVTAVTGFIYLYFRYYRTAQTGDRIPGLRRQIGEYALPLTATSTADVLDKRIDTILVGFFIGPVSVAYYTIGKQVITFVQTPMSALGFTLSPTYEAQRVKGNPDTAARIYEQALSYSLLLYVPAAAGLILVAEPLVELVFGNQYLGAVPVLQVLAVYALLRTVTTLTSSGLDYLGRAQERAVAKIVTSVLNAILNVLLIPSIGVLGAAIATVITYSIYTFVNVYIIGTVFDIRIGQLVRHLIVVLLITSIMSAIVSVFIGYITGFITLFSVIILGMAVWAVLATALGVLDVRQAISTAL